VEAPRPAVGPRKDEGVIRGVARSESKGEEVAAQRREQGDGPRAIVAGLAARDDVAVDVLLGIAARGRSYARRASSQ
jgi:hypothetical protein